MYNWVKNGLDLVNSEMNVIKHWVVEEKTK